MTIDKTIEAINENCPVCGQQQDVEKMSLDQFQRLSHMNMVSDISLRLFEFLGEYGMSKSPMMTKIAVVNHETGVDVFSVDLWCGTGDTPISRLGVKNAEIDALAAELKQLREFVGAMNRVAIEEWHGVWIYDRGVGYFTFCDSDGNFVASGTDPFDAWRKMNAGEGE